MKNIIIAGVPRSGKTLLANRLNTELGFSRIPADALVSTFYSIFPEHGISHFASDHHKVCEAFCPVLRELLRQLEYEGFPFVIDAYHVMPQTVADLKDTYGIVFMGYPSADPRTKLRHIRRCSRPHDWTEEVADEELLEQIRRYVDESTTLEKACSECGIPFADMSIGFEQTIQTAFEMLTESTE